MERRRRCVCVCVSAIQPCWPCVSLMLAEPWVPMKRPQQQAQAPCSCVCVAFVCAHTQTLGFLAALGAQDPHTLKTDSPFVPSKQLYRKVIKIAEL